MSDSNYAPVKPTLELELFGESFSIEGSFALIEKVERTMAESIINLVPASYDMPVYRFALLLSALLKEGGGEMNATQTMEALFEQVGINTLDYTVLRLKIGGFLRICICKPADRDAESKKLGEQIGQLTALSNSLGANTASSA